MYCVKCKFKTDTRNVESLISANGRLMSGGDCVNCGCKKRQFTGGAVGKKPVWTDELAEELHKPIRRKFPKRRVYSSDIDKIWAADLVDMSGHAKENNGVKYLLAVIDVFSKYGWLEPLKTKRGEEVAEALKKILNKRKPPRGVKLWVDKGKEFYNKWVKDLIETYSTENEEKSSVVERWNRTMKEKMYKYFTANNTRKYINILDKMVNDYNNRTHSSIGMTPTDASNPENADDVRARLYPPLEPTGKPKFEVGDLVRIGKKKKTFEKGYTARWTEEVFKVTAVRYTTPITYKIAGLDGEEIEGTFYEPELQKSKQEVFRIEKIIRKRGKKSLVKWMGYPESFNSWVDTDTIMGIQ